MTNRRDALSYLTKGAAVVATLGLSGVLLRSCGPDAATLAAQDARTIAPPSFGSLTKVVQDHPILVKRLSSPEKAAAFDLGSDANAHSETLRYPTLNRGERTTNAPPATADHTLYGQLKDLLVLSLRCTKGSCVTVENMGDWGTRGGFFCPCCATHYDALGRMRKGIGSNNLFVPTLTAQLDGRYLIGDIPEDWFRTR